MVHAGHTCESCRRAAAVLQGPTVCLRPLLATAWLPTRQLHKKAGNQADSRSSPSVTACPAHTTSAGVSALCLNNHCTSVLPPKRSAPVCDQALVCLQGQQHQLCFNPLTPTNSTLLLTATALQPVIAHANCVHACVHVYPRNTAACSCRRAACAHTHLCCAL